MTNKDWPALKQLFSELSALPKDQCTERLAGIRETQPGLASELEELLTVFRQPTNAITNAVEDAATALDHPQGDALIGRTLGAYRISHHLARGGMGDVYVADRVDGAFEQRVAIKLIGSRITTRDAELRFQSEREILAKLEHPSIARVLDGGNTPEGAAYLVMEYIEGTPIDIYCTKKTLSLEDRLRLFIKVCAAVQFAHQNLVVHRDIKPSNILVTQDGEPKLLDFGIAKNLDAAAVDSAEVTLLDERAMTPDFASPEQVLGDAITTSSDIYSLGVLLYLLIAGRQPYTMQGLRPSERERLLCETEPPKPSVTASMARDLEPAATSTPWQPATLRGDLDAIVLTAMHKQPIDRYTSARSLGDDLQAYLDNLPVTARGRTFSYLTQKFLRRHRAAAAIGLLLASSAIGATTYHTATVTAERDRAQVAASESDTMLQFLTDVFEVPADKLGDTVTAKEILDIGAARLDQDFSGQPQIRANLGLRIADVYYNLMLDQSAREQYQAVIPLFESTGDTQNLAYAELGLGNVLRAQDEYDEAMQHYTEARRQADLLADLTPMERYRFVLEPAYAQFLSGDYDAARAGFEEIMATGEQLSQTSHETYRSARANLAQLLDLQGDTATAEPLMKAAIDAIIDSGNERDADLPTYQHNYAKMLDRLGRSQEAEAQYLESYERYVDYFGQDSQQLSTAMTNIGNFYRSERRIEEARDWLQRAVQHAKRTNGDDSFDAAYSLRNLARLEHGEGRFDVAEPLFQETIRLFSQSVGTDHPHVASSRVSYAMMLNTMERHEEALIEAEMAYAICQQSLPETHGLTYTTRLITGQAQLGAGQLDNARATLEDVFRDINANQPGHWGRLDAARSLKQYYETVGDTRNADDYQRMIDSAAQ